MTTGALDGIMLEAFASRREGRLSDAEAACRQILSREPRHAEALQLLGTLAGQTGHGEIAVELLRRSIAVDPNRAEPHNNLGVALEGLGRHGEAENAYRMALQIAPHYPEARYNLANLHEKSGRPDEAIAEYRRAIGLNPTFVQAWNNLARTLLGQAQFAEAAEACREALRIDPGHAAAHHNLGASLRAMDALEEAAAAFREAARLAPARAEFQRSLASLLHAQKAHEEAVAVYREAVRLEPGDAVTRFNLGCCLSAAGCLDEAITEYRRAVEIAPDFAVAYVNLGQALQLRGHADEAEAASRTAILLEPALPPAYVNLGNALKDKGCLEEAIRSYRRAIELKPDAAAFHSNLVYSAAFHPDFDAAMLLAEAREWDRRHAAHLRRSPDFRDRDRDPERRLRIGYVSPDFRNHVVGKNFLPLLRAHRREEVEVYCYSNTSNPDETTGEIEARADVWRDLCCRSDIEAAELIFADRIDVLVDLTLHMAGNRLLVFARKPAPVQASYLGYYGTTGLESIDYRLSDPFIDPPGEDVSCYSEKTLRLPHCTWCYEPPGPMPETTPLPALERGFVTFICRNNFAKVSPEALDLWVEILDALAGSRLILNAPAGAAQERVLARFAERQISGERLEFASNHEPWDEFIRGYGRADIALDPFPYSGWITTCDALWMGLPVVTLSGRTAVGRGGCSILSNLGLTGLIASDPKRYVEIALALAGDLPRLSQLRSGLRQCLEVSPLRDAKGFARDVESAYRQMWRA
ncbi:MAG TPA: tetratricopeptide repeat protein, partial [Chthoniobacteraceae bacterium]